MSVILSSPTSKKGVRGVLTQFNETTKTLDMTVVLRAGINLREKFHALRLQVILANVRR